MKNKKEFYKKRILSQMFDIKPVDQAGDLDMKKIKRIKRTVKLKNELNEIKKTRIVEPKKEVSEFYIKENNVLFREEQERFKRMLLAEKEIAERENRIKVQKQKLIEKEKQGKFIQCKLDKERNNKLKIELRTKKKQAREKIKKSYLNKWRKKLYKTHYLVSKLYKKYLQLVLAIRKKQGKIFFSLAKVSVTILIVLFFLNYINKGLEIKRNGLSQTQKAFAKMLVAKDNIKDGKFKQSFIQFNDAHNDLDNLDKKINSLGSIIVNATRYVPYLSKISSGQHLIKAGNDISQIGILTSELLQKIETIKTQNNSDPGKAYLTLFKNSRKDLQKIASLLQDAQSNLDKTNVDDVPEKNRNQFLAIKDELPHINSAVKTFLTEEDVFIDILGGNTPRKYLFLFQNNQEMRATGGFIGSYGLLDIFNGKVRQFFVDGIYNLDGQLKVKVVPPVPIQKISANWSLHDSNWWPNFPTSAEKAIWFYEKEGGPTVDGVVALTPQILQDLLKITGPIDMPKYGLVINENNFIPVLQEQIEVNYDKTLNHPKRILSDLAPKILDKLLTQNKFSDFSRLANVVLKNLNEKQILVYSRNWKIEKILSHNNWSGEILTTPKDYLSVINSNINGFKTDGVIDEKIFHQTQIKEDGSIIDTVTIKRKHNGGNTPFPWWNKVNADYMRVYVPQGARLISAEGQTREFDTPPLDYSALNFKRDSQVQTENDKIKIDEQSGTRIYNENGKTVFANWVYVSPGESVTVKYVYVLPFKITTNIQKPADTYSLLVQKQSGSVNSQLIAEVDYPKIYKSIWQYPQNKISQVDNLNNNQIGIKLETNLKTDAFIGMALSKK